MNQLEHGSKLMEKVFGNDVANQISQNLQASYPPMLDFLKSTFGEIYSNDVLDLKTKEIIVISSLVTQKDTKPQLKVHIKAALRAGLSPKEIMAIMLQLVIYVGFPAALNALNAAKEAFDEVNIVL